MSDLVGPVCDDGGQTTEDVVRQDGGDIECTVLYCTVLHCTTSWWWTSPSHTYITYCIVVVCMVPSVQNCLMIVSGVHF